MRQLLALIILIFSVTGQAQWYCGPLAGVNAADIQVTYSSSTGISIGGTFGSLQPATFRVEYRNLTDNGPWQNRTNSTRNNGRWFADRLEQSKEYKVRIFAPYKGRWCEIDMHHIWTHLNTADFTLNGQSSGTVSVCGNDPITMNAAASRYETHYGIAIREIDASGRGVGPEMMYERSGQAPNGINIRSIASSKNFSLIGGKRYYVKLFTRPNWQEKIIILDMNPASLAIRPLANPVAGSNEEFTSCVLRGPAQLSVDASGSTCDTRYMVHIVEMANGQELEATRFNQWITPFTPLPDRLDVAAIYRNAGFNFVAGKRYKVIIAVGFPWAADHFYVKFLTPRQCTAQPVKTTNMRPRF
ncbi:MAG: hypothetical protein AAF597_01985 [Bacteroidota bacterium]